MNIGSINLTKIIKCTLKSFSNKHTYTKKPPWSVLFFGSDEFSVYSLKELYSEYKNGTALSNLEVVTTTKGKPNAVRKYAEEHKLRLHSWPVTVPENTFDVGLVVSFGHLIPENIIKQFHFGMLNVHASLLPRWRGAAPIIYALANGDKETGITIMRIRPKYFDVGEIITQAKVPISNATKMPDLHEMLGCLGAKHLVQCLQNLPEQLRNAVPQPNEGVTFAPKVTPEFAVIRWAEMTSSHICNLDRAVTGLFSLTTTWNGTPVKLVDVSCTSCESGSSSSDKRLLKPGYVTFNKSQRTLCVMCANKTWISVGRVGVFGKKIMTAIDFNNGYVKKRPLERRYFT